jgi:hypothetical protein
VDPEFRREVRAAVTAGLIIAVILAVGGLLYSALKGLSFVEFVGFVALPATALGLIASLALAAVSLVRVLNGLIEMCGKLEQGLEQTTKRLGEAEDQLGRQVAETAYSDVIAEAKADGWTVSAGERGALHFSHPKYGTAGTGGGEEIDPDRLRLLLSIGQGVRAVRDRSDD